MPRITRRQFLANAPLLAATSAISSTSPASAEATPPLSGELHPSAIGPCDVVAVQKITLSGLQVIGESKVSQGQRVLVTMQPDKTKNGIYIADPGPWRRALDFSHHSYFRPGQIILSAYKGASHYAFRLVGKYPIIPDLSPVSFEPAQLHEAENINYADRVAPRFLKTLSDIANGQEVSVLRFIDRRQHPAIQARSSNYDAARELQEAIDVASQTYWPAGTYCVGDSIDLKTQRTIRGDFAGTELRTAAEWTSRVPILESRRYSPVLVRAPILYNSKPIDYFRIHGLMINGGDKDCYGIYLHENFHGSISDVIVYRTARRPYTNIRGQVVRHENVIFFECGDGVLTYDNSRISFTGCDWQRLKGDWCFDQRQPNDHAKGGVRIAEGWFESAVNFAPRRGFLRVSGRGNDVCANFAWHEASADVEMLNLNDNSEVLITDKLELQAQPCTRGSFDLNNSTGRLKVVCSPGSNANSVAGSYTAERVSDNGLGNSFDLNASLQEPTPHVTRRFQVRASRRGVRHPVGRDDFVIDIDDNSGDPVIRILGHRDNAIQNARGALEFSSANALHLAAQNGQKPVSLDGSRYVLQGASGPGGFKRPLFLGEYALWVDGAGALRAKRGPPNFDGDGSKIGDCGS